MALVNDGSQAGTWEWIGTGHYAAHEVTVTVPGAPGSPDTVISIAIPEQKIPVSANIVSSSEESLQALAAALAPYVANLKTG